jgi:hypothetical protein
MAHILHYEEIKGNKEYVVITEEDDDDEIREQFEKLGFRFYKSYEIEDIGTLPTDRALSPD